MQYDVQNLITNLFALSDIPCVQELLQALVCNGLGGNCSIGETTINEAIDCLADHQKSLIDNNTCMPDKEKQEAKREVDHQSEIFKKGIKTDFQEHKLLV